MLSDETGEAEAARAAMDEGAEAHALHRSLDVECAIAGDGVSDRHTLSSTDILGVRRRDVVLRQRDLEPAPSASVPEAVLSKCSAKCAADMWLSAPSQTDTPMTRRAPLRCGDLADATHQARHQRCFMHRSRSPAVPAISAARRAATAATASATGGDKPAPSSKLAPSTA